MRKDWVGLSVEEKVLIIHKIDNWHMSLLKEMTYIAGNYQQHVYYPGMLSITQKFLSLCLRQVFPSLLYSQIYTLLIIFYFVLFFPGGKTGENAEECEFGHMNER